MHGLDGASYQNGSVFVEIVTAERMVLDHVSGPPFRLTIVLAEQGGETKITWRMCFESAAECKRIKKSAVEANQQNLDRLEAALTEMVVA